MSIGKRLSSCLLIAAFVFSLSAQMNLYAQREGDAPSIDRLTFRQSPLESVLAMLENLTGRAVLRPAALHKTAITFDSQGPISVEKAILAIESLLRLNGIGVTRMGDDFITVVQLNTLRTEAPELVIGPIRDWPASGKVVSKLFRLEYLDSQTFQTQITPFLNQTVSNITPFQNSNAVLVTDTVVNLQRIEYVLSEVDKPSRLNIKPEFYTLNYAQASEVAQQIQALIDSARNSFGAQNNQGQTNRPAQRNTQGQTVRTGGNSGTTGGAIPEQILFGTATAISSDDRTNQLIIMTEPANLGFFEDIIDRLDVKADPTTRIEVIALKHADAVEVASLLSEFVSGRGSDESSDRQSQNSNRNTQRSGPFRENEGPEPSRNTGNANTRSQSSSAGDAEDRESQFSDFMTIIADERSNSLVVSGTVSDRELVRGIVERVDVLLPQVRIEVIIAEVNLNKDSGLSRGMDAFTGSYDKNSDTFNIGSDNVPGLNIFGLGIPTASFTPRDGQVKNLTMDFVLNTVRSNNDIKLLSVPTIMTTHNQEATIIVGEARPIVTSSQTSSLNNDSVRSSFQFQDIAITLTVTPLIGPNDVIQMDIDQQIDDVIDSVIIDNNSQPVIGRRQATSFVSVKNGEIIVFAGLRKSRQETKKSKMAIVGDIPVLGGIFGKKAKDKTQSELMIFIRPKVVRSTDQGNTDANAVIDKAESSSFVREYVENNVADVAIEPEKAETEGETTDSAGKRRATER